MICVDPCSIYDWLSSCLDLKIVCVIWHLRSFSSLFDRTFSPFQLVISLLNLSFLTVSTYHLDPFATQYDRPCAAMHSRRLSEPVCLASVAHGYDVNHQLLAKHLVDHAIISDANAP